MHAVSWAGVACSVDDCGAQVRASGYCMAHYKRWKRWGDPNIKRPVTPAPERFWRNVEKSGPTPEGRPGLGACWVWTAGRISTGYGCFSITKWTKALAHRWAYESEVGPIPDGLVIDHLCRNRLCVRPSHLEPVTGEENLRRGAGYGLRNGMRSECRNGHEYTEENTYVDPTRGTVRCRECGRIRDRARSTTRKAA